MGTQGVGTFLINSKFASGSLVFYEKAVGRTATGDVLTIGTGAVTVGGTAQDVDFAWYATGSASAILDGGGTSFTLVGVNLATNAPVVITDATASTSTTTGALIVTGGVGVAGAAFFGGLVTSNSVTGFRSLPTFVPDSTRTNYGFAIGTRATELDVTTAGAATQNLDPMQINLNIIGTAPTGTSTINGIYQLITHDTVSMPNIRLKGCDWTIDVGEACTDAYVMQTELIVTGTKTSSGELMAMSALTTLGTGARTADRVCALQAMITGAGTAGTVVGDCFVAYIVNGGTVVTTDAVLKVFNQSASTATNLASIETDGTCTSMLQFVNDGTVTYLLDIDDNSANFVSTGGATQGANPKKIKIYLDGVAKYIPAADNWS